jgi:hypothetical protein
VLDPGTDEVLVGVLAGLDPEDEPMVITDRAEELRRRYAGRMASTLDGATRLVVPDELVLAGRRRPLLDALRSARKLGIPVQSSSGAPLNPTSVVRRRLR